MTEAVAVKLSANRAPVVTPDPAGSAAAETTVKIIDGLHFTDEKRTISDDAILNHIRASVRRGHPQLWNTGLKPDRIALVGGGPSLESTLPDLIELVRSGAKLVTVNGAYRWCVERNLQPSAQVVLDGRPGTARFVDPEIPKCRYYLASQCHPSVWDAVEGRDQVAIWHSVAPDSTSPEGQILTEYYGGNWQGVAGGTTVITRALGLLRMLGYLRFDLFGVDSCFLGDRHHAYPQTENEHDLRFRVTVAPADHPELARDFWCAPWHVKQAEDFALTVRILGSKFLLNVHGDGLIAYMLKSAADCVISQKG